MRDVVPYVSKHPIGQALEVSYLEVPVETWFATIEESTVGLTHLRSLHRMLYSQLHKSSM